MKKRIFRDRIVAYRKNDKYLAVSLEFDLLAEGDSILDSLKRLDEATQGYLEMCCAENEPDEEIYRKAPKKYQDIYDLFVDLSRKKVKRDEQKRKEMELNKKDTVSMQRTYSPENLCHA